MNFDSLVKGIASKVRKQYVKHKTSAKLDQYRHSPRLRLSKIYGYRQKEGERAERVPEEAAIVRKVFDQFAQGKSVDSIKNSLDEAGDRTRFRNKFSTGQLLSFGLNSLYAGLVPRKLGGYVRSAVYPPIISPDVFERVKKTVTKQLQASEIDPVKAVWGGRS
jgi:Recombinase